MSGGLENAVVGRLDDQLVELAQRRAAALRNDFEQQIRDGPPSCEALEKLPLLLGADQVAAAGLIFHDDALSAYINCAQFRGETQFRCRQ